MWEWFVAVFLKELFKFFAEGFARLYAAYTNRKADESINRENRERTEKAETEAERREAIDNIADRLGRRP